MNLTTIASGPYLSQELSDSPFIGRVKEVGEIDALLMQPACRVLTLVGPGGIGKTRLALQVAAHCQSAFERGVFVVFLQPLRSVEFFATAVAAALGVSLTGSEPPLVQLGRYLSDKEALIVVDNFEHLQAASADLLSLSAAAPKLTFLITSREALNLKEEWLYLVRGLSFPTEAEHKPTGADDDAIQLFIERARQVHRGFSPANEMAAIVDICRLVEGMPLALELAAAWRKAADCRQIATEIESGLAFLTSRFRNVSQRHQSMRTVFDQTWKRLDEAEQEVFKRLSVFRGGFEQSAAETVTGATLAELSTLVDKSLLRLDSGGRYQIHELLRQYGAEQLAAADDVDRAQARHAAYFIDFLDGLAADVGSGRQREALLAIKHELDNIRVAWLWAVVHGIADSLRRGSEALGLFYQFQGGYLEGMNLFSQATAALLAQPSDDSVDRALLGTRMYEGWYHLRFGRQEGTEACMAQSRAIYERLGSPPLAGYLTDPGAPLAFVALTRGDYGTAVQLAERVRQVAERHDHPINRQFAYHLLSAAHMGLGNYSVAQSFAQQAYAQSLATGDRWFRAYILNNMGEIAVALGDNAMGKTHFQASYDIRQAFDDPEGMALALVNLGNLALAEQAYDEAKEEYQRSREIYQEINDKGGLAAADWGLGQVFMGLGSYALTQGYFRQALEVAVAIDYRPVLFGLLVDIADLLWRLGERRRPLMLLAFTIHNMTTDHKTQRRAQVLLTQFYEPQVAASLFGTSTAEGQSSDLMTLTDDLLYRFSVLPAAAPAVEVVLASLAAPAQPLIEPLTPRELDVLALLCTGRMNKEIAADLGLATGTVKYYTGQIYGKLGVRNRVSAVSRARELHLVRDD
jgi:predicted ATPase/DNA-binding CsgD family transcriptional regulator